ncbi:MAG: C39 family peptidase [Lachnospiraceae bacterium]|jgi:hypothetical protein|nr:C39 family peptidase [Lachnospiraceae bacterium]
MKQKKKVRHSNRRRQQVRRQLLLIGCVIFIAICAIGSCQVHKKRSEAKEAAKIEQQKKEEKKEKKKTEKKETPEEHLERVRAKAISAGYPDDVIELLDKNPETVDFVENYPKKKDSKPAETIGDSLQPGSIPLLLQWDERWGYSTYGTSIIAISGCGPTCMAMVASGLNQDPSITPAKVASFGTQHSYVDEENNTYWSFMREAGASWNLSCYEGLLNETQVSAELSAGHPIICSVGPGNFTQIGHFIVLTGYENGNVTVNDPFSKANSETLWNFSQIKDQIRAMWVYSLK